MNAKLIVEYSFGGTKKSPRGAIANLSKEKFNELKGKGIVVEATPEEVKAWRSNQRSASKENQIKPQQA